MGTLLSNTKYRDKPENRGMKILLTVIILAVSCVMIIPFVFMLSSSFKYAADVTGKPLEIIPGRLNLNNYIDVFKYDNFYIWFKNTFVVVTCVVILSFLVISLAAYGFARLNFRGKNILFLYVVAGMMVPADLTIIARYIEFKYLGLINTLLVLIIPALFNAWLVFLLRQFFMGIPVELSEAALIDGCSHLQIWYKIVLPLSRSAATTVVVFAFIWSWNSYLEPSVFIMDMKKQVLSVGINYFAQSVNGGGINAALMMAGACVSIVPVLIIFLCMQDQLVEGIAASGIKG